MKGFKFEECPMGFYWCFNIQRPEDRPNLVELYQAVNDGAVYFAAMGRAWREPAKALKLEILRFVPVVEPMFGELDL